MQTLTARAGIRPDTSSDGPHRQLSQNAPPEVWGKLVAAVMALSSVTEGHSEVSLVSSRALLLEADEASGPREAFLADCEFAHVHDVFDGSLHLCLPADRAREVCELGWGEPHGYAERDTEVMVYGPRDETELDVVVGLVAESLSFARGE